MNEKIKILLNQKLSIYYHPDFLLQDPIQIPRKFSLRQDIEISGFFAALLAWGNRTYIINSCNKLLELMDHSPYDFILNHQEHDLKRFLHFTHRTFNATDLLFIISKFKKTF